MKKIFIVAAIALSGLCFQQASAQLRVSLNLNIGSQPAWGPTGYDYVQYYYLPDINCYYDVSRSQYIYLSGNRWRRASSLPAMYRNYDIYNSYKVVLSGNRGTTPYRNNKADIAQYGQYKGRGGQEVIRDSRDAKYNVNKGNKYYKSGNSRNSRRR
ncbi:MAG: hypothetical protein LBE82_02505 [Chitinophagaceae bacterium]|jgi:hypothetical protein|nr:hypothetical protein [Chitinophagaceae bacterium]